MEYNIRKLNMYEYSFEMCNYTYFCRWDIDKDEFIVTPYLPEFIGEFDTPEIRELVKIRAMEVIEYLDDYRDELTECIRLIKGEMLMD